MDNENTDAAINNTGVAKTKWNLKLNRKAIVAALVGSALVASFGIGYAVHGAFSHHHRVNHCLLAGGFPTPVAPVNDDIFLPNWVLPAWQSDQLDSLFANAPRISAKELPKEVVVTASNLPPINEKNLDVKVQGQSLVINAEQDRNNVLKAGKDERSQAQASILSFHASVPLPNHVQTEKLQTNFRNGILTVSIPKS